MNGDWQIVAHNNELRAQLAAKDTKIAELQSENSNLRAIVSTRENELAAKDAKIAGLHDLLELFEDGPCPLCHGDCASANWPVINCPMIALRAACAKDLKEPE